ncbi:phage/plasmid primase, P4 family [Salinibacterium sp. ZJ450]|uniref:phage/plasmid primase, P4 family n=1 Tax=Salinibacterium sp. ZJ450 TaxID=2708338 RepID=UPI0014220C2F|nr:phage/plasmid primase, P4 family [Salinibacterium sp. ZJ450]
MSKQQNTTNSIPEATRATAPSDFEDLSYSYGNDERVATWAQRYMYDRAISPEVADARGYYVPETPSDWTVARFLGVDAFKNAIKNKSHFTANEDYEREWNRNPKVRPLGIPLYSIENGPNVPVSIQIRPQAPITVQENVLDANGAPVMVKVKGKEKKTDEATGVVTEVEVENQRRKTKPKNLKFLAPMGVKRGDGSIGTLPAPDVHPLVQELLAQEDPGDRIPMLYTEGIHKADSALSAALRSGRKLITAAVTGVQMGFHAPATEENDSGEPILTKGMRAIAWEGRDVYIAFDPDWRSKPAVAGAMLTTARLLEAAGAQVFIIDVPTSSGVNGLDDYLAASDDTALWELFENAISPNTADRHARRYPQDDIGRAARLADELRALGTYKFNYTKKYRPMHFDGKRWDEDKKLTIQNLAIKLTERDLEDKAGRSRRAIDSAIALSQSTQGLVVTSEEFDQDPYLLNAQNGTIDLKTATIEPHSPMDMITTITPVPCDFSMPTPVFLSFLHDISCGDADMILYLQLMAGSALIGKATTKLHVFLGSGGNGKSLFQALLRNVLGGDYVSSMKASTLLDGATDVDMAGLRGKRLVMVAELSMGTHLKDGALKTITSTDEVNARAVFENGIVFVPSWTIMLSSNHFPNISDTSEGMWRRIHAIPFDFEVKKKKGGPDALLEDKLRREYPGILAWMVEGARKYIEAGEQLERSGRIETETARHRVASDILADFLATTCVVDPDTRYDRTEITQAFREYMQQQGKTAWSQSTLHKALIEKGVIPKDKPMIASSGVRYWPGLRLATATEVASALRDNFGEHDPATAEGAKALVDEALAALVQNTGGIAPQAAPTVRKVAPATPVVIPEPKPGYITNLITGAQYPIRAGMSNGPAIPGPFDDDWDESEDTIAHTPVVFAADEDAGDPSEVRVDTDIDMDELLFS